MINIYDYLGFLKLNSEDDELNYFPGDCESDYSAHDELMYLDEEDTDAGETDIHQIDESNLIETAEFSLMQKIRNSKHGDLTGKKIGMLKVKCVDAERSIQDRRVYCI